MQPTVTTSRLVLRPLAHGDAPCLADIFAGEGVRRYLFDNEEVRPETVAAILAASLRQSAQGLGLWLIVKADIPIGCVGLQQARPNTIEIFSPFEGAMEVTIALKEDHWGARYAAETLRAMLACAASTLQQRRVVALVDAPNEASHALFRRCEFREIGGGQGPLYRALAYERLLE
jgi:ribosomal-protein-alanine N-acetyltransferase